MASFSPSPSPPPTLPPLSSTSLSLSPPLPSPLYPEGIPREEVILIDVILFSVMSALAVVGVVLTVVCLLFNLIFMRKK